MTKLYLLMRRSLTVFLMFGAMVSFAQGQITGKVTSADDGSALPGVNVVEKGTGNGTTTDAEGNYTLKVGGSSTLVFTFVGYASQEISVGVRSVIDVVLQSDVTSLSEVVVVGYGSQEKKEITGAVVSLDTKDFNKGNVNDPTGLLQGKVAGLSIYNKGSDPNQSATIRLRGLSTVGANVSPLVVVDGVLGASLDNIDPNDIASINVLKDGSAAAIYGSRGSSGVILVTTKRGSKKGGGLGVSFNSYVAVASVYKKIPIMDRDQYVAAGGNDLGSNTNWQDLVTQNGVSAVQNLAISGGNETTSFRMSTNLRNVNGILKNSGFDQVNTRANLTHSALDNRIRVDLNMAVTNRNIDYSFNEALRYATLYNPTAPVYFPNGQYYQAILFDNFNPVAILNQNTSKGVSRNINYSAKLDFDILKNLTFTVNYAQQFDNLSKDAYYASNSLWRGYNRHGLANRYESQKYFTLFEAYGTYTKSFDKIDFTAAAGYSYQEDQFKDLKVNIGNFPSDLLGTNQLQSSGDLLSGITGSNNIDISSSKTPVNKIIAQFARVNFMFDKAIFFNASVRREGSTKLGSANQVGLFPAVGAGIDITKYLPIRNINLLKFRLGYGVTGSLPGVSGQSQDQFSYSTAGGGAVSPSLNGNPNLKWEKKSEINAGLEFALLDSKITGSLDVYSRTISDFVIQRTVPTTQYASGLQYQNAGSLYTPGIELTLNYNDISFGDLKWTPGIVFSHYTTYLQSYIIPSSLMADFGAPGQNGTNIIRLDEGKAIGQIWGPVFDHVSTGTGSDASVSKGAPVFQDLNGDGKVDANPSNALVSGDFKKLGSGIPSAEIGWSNRLTFRNWDMNVFFRSAIGHSLVNQFRAFYEPIDPGAINSYNRVITSKAPAGLNSAQYSSLYVEKADFFRLDNLTIGYNFKLPSNGRIKSFRLYGSGQNLFVITNYTGIDPDPSLLDYGSVDNGNFQSTTPNVLAPGIDRRNNYFTARTFTFGLNVNF